MERHGEARHRGRMDHDAIVIGGGIAGSSVAIALARAKRRVLLVEPERAFRDRIRGEGLHSWGVAEARKLGVLSLLLETCARSLPSWDVHVAGRHIERRDLPSSTLAGCTSLSFSHPEMQETLLAEATRAGAHVARGVRLTGIEPGDPVRVTLDGEPGDARAPLVVLATGRSAVPREVLGLTTVRGEAGLSVAGLQLEGVDAREDAVAMFLAPALGILAPWFPLPRGRARLYLAFHPSRVGRTFAGAGAIAAFLDTAREVGVPAAWLEGATASGPLGTFDGTPVASRGVPPPGIALVGDAAGSLDPAFGAGLSLALLDARTLTDAVLGGATADEACRAHRAERAGYYARLVRLESILRRVLYGSTSGAPPRLDLLPSVRELRLDTVGGGPWCRVDDDAERALFGSVASPDPTAWLRG